MQLSLLVSQALETGAKFGLTDRDVIMPCVCRGAQIQEDALGLENQESLSKVLSGAVPVRSHPEHEWIALWGFLHV